MQVKGKLTVVAFLLLASCGDLFAAVYWISTQGKATGVGTKIDPFPSIDVALRCVGGGNTFIFRPGLYINPDIILRPEYSGSPLSPTILKSEQKYEAVLHGSKTHNIHVRPGCDWVIIDGFESSGARYSGIKTNGEHTVIRNCFVHNNARHGVKAHNETLIENNLIEYNGQHPSYEHGIYAGGNNLIVRNNIVRFNSCCGSAVAAGAVVVKDVPDNCVVAGVPAKVIKRDDSS